MCNDIINTSEYGWIKLLPCGIGDTVYRIQFTTNNAPKKNRKHLFTNSPWERKLKKSAIVDSKVISLKMHYGFYAGIHKYIFLTENEALEAMKAWSDKLL